MRPVVLLDFGTADMNEKFIPRLLMLKFLDRDNAADKVELQFRNEDQQLTERYPAGIAVRFRFGYPNNLTQPRSFTIRKMKGAGNEILTVTGFSAEFALDNEKKNREFVNVTYVDIATEIALEAGYPLDRIVVPTPREFNLPFYESVNQVAETDAQFLRRLAKDLPNIVFWMDESYFHFHEPQHGKRPRRVIEYKTGMLIGNVVGLDSDLNLVQKPDKVTKKGYDQKAKQEKSAVANSQQEGKVLGAYEPGLFDKGATNSLIYDSKTGIGVETYVLGDHVVEYNEGGLPVVVGLVEKEQAEVAPSTADDSTALQAEADQKLKKKKGSRIKFSLRCDPADPQFKAKEVIELRGATIFDGPSYVKEVQHTVRPGKYDQEAKLIKGYLGKKPKKGPAASQTKEAGGEVNKESYDSTAASTKIVAGEGGRLTIVHENLPPSPFDLPTSHWGGV